MHITCHRIFWTLSKSRVSSAITDETNFADHVLALWYAVGMASRGYRLKIFDWRNDTRSLLLQFSMVRNDLGKRNCFSFSKIRSHGADWKHWWFVFSGQAKKSYKMGYLGWDRSHNVPGICGKRSVWESPAQIWQISPTVGHSPTTVSVSPMSKASWLGQYVVKFSALSKEWWVQNVMKSSLSRDSDWATQY